MEFSLKMICSRFTAEWLENKVSFWRRSKRVWLLADQEMTFPYRWEINTYKSSSTCSGFGILYPCWSKFAIFLPSIRGYGEPPLKKKRKKKKESENLVPLSIRYWPLGINASQHKKYENNISNKNIHAVDWYDLHITTTPKRTTSNENIHLSSIHKKRWLVFISELSISKEPSRVFMLKINIYLS